MARKAATKSSEGRGKGKRKGSLVTVGQRLVAARLALDQGQLQFAQTLGISKQRLNNYERDLRPVDIDIAFAISKRWREVGLPLPLEWVYFGEETDVPEKTREALDKVEALVREKAKRKAG